MPRSHRILVATLAALALKGASAADECATDVNLNTCRAAGQLCVDPNPNNANDWTCRCESWLGYTDATVKVGVAAAATGCTRVAVCNANAATCTAANQACIAKDGGIATDFQCRCIPPYYCDNNDNAVAPAQSLDECGAVCQSCSDKGDGNGNSCNRLGQVCTDPDKTNTAGDFACTCPAGGNPPCTYAAGSECTANAATCTGSGQGCEDLTLAATANDWRCVCVGPASGMATAAAVTTCEIDECASACPTCATQGGDNVCALKGQVCVDPSKTVLGDWRCDCPMGATKTSGGLQAPAVCTYPGPTASGCNTNWATCGKGQFCYDPTPTQTTTWGCMCLEPATGTFNVGAPAACILNECTADCPTCAGLTCQKYGQACTEVSTALTALGDWSCTCDGLSAGAAVVGRPATCGGTGVCAAATCFTTMKSCTDVGGTATCGCVAPTTGTTTCVFDECTVNSCIAPFTCTDPNTAMTSLGDWMCTVNECTAVCPTCARKTVGGPHTCFDVGQTCTDATSTTTGDWSCVCAGDSTGAAVVGAVATCVAPAASECTKYGSFCAGAKQSCSDPSVSTASDWLCNCLNAASTKTGGVASVATCTLDECTAVCPTCAAGLCGAGQTCVDPNTAETSTGDWFCQCNAPASGTAVGKAATCITDECNVNQATCQAASQECFDPDKTNTGDWQCRCPHDIAQTQNLAIVAACTWPAGDECTANKATCTANQYCEDANAANPNDWQCKCVTPLYAGAPVTAMAATCTLDPCAGTCTNCANTGSGNLCAAFGQTCTNNGVNYKCVCPVGQKGEKTSGVATCVIDECDANAGTCAAGQTCVDTNKAPASTGDWYCVCTNGPRAKAGPATCAENECVGNSVCPTGQTCNDPNTLVAGDWRCLCDSDNAVFGVAKAAVCPVDECVGNSACPAGQTCDDPNEMLTGDWVCMCDADNSVTAVAMAAVCNINECVNNTICVNGQTCTDPNNLIADDWRCNCVGGGFVVKGPCVNECTGNSVCSAASQVCVDDDQASTSNWKCRCNTAVDSTTTAFTDVANCTTTLDECGTTPCSSGQTCNDPVKLSNSTGDFTCSCTSGAVNTGGPADCNIVNECTASPCGSGQTCVEPNQAVLNDFRCTCTSDTTKVGTGKPASPCGTYEDECFACPGSGCACGTAGDQTCTDPQKLVTSKSDYVCKCTANSLSAVGKMVANCNADTPAPPPAGPRYFFEFRSLIAANQFSEAKTMAAIAKVVNFIEGTSNLDTNVVNCNGCSQVVNSNIKKHCFAATCASIAQYAASTSRHFGVLQGSSEGVFEFVSTAGTTEIAKQTWLNNLQQSQAALTADPDIQLVSGTFVSDTITPQPVAQSDDDDSLPWWVWLLLALCIILCILLCILLWWFKFRDSKEKKQEEEEAVKTYENEMQEHRGEQGNGANGGDKQELYAPQEDYRNGEGRPLSTGSNASDLNKKNGSYDGKHDGRGGSNGVNPITTVFPAGGAGGAGGRQSNLTPVPVASPGSRHTSPLMTKETVLLGFGRNLEGQLGLGDAEDLKVQYTPIEIPDFRGMGVSMTACGSFHTFVVLVDHTVMVFGEGGDGQLGLGNRLSPKIPTPVPFFKGKCLRLVACGEQHSIIVCDDNLYACGSGQDGQLGLGDVDDRMVPAALPLFSGRGINVDMVACGSHHTCVVYDGMLYTMGWNRFGQLGLGDDVDRNEPCEVAFFRGKQIRDVTCGVQHTVVLCNDGVYVMGGNTFGQLGLGHQMNQHDPQRVAFFDGKVVKSISAWFHTLVCCDDGVYAFGEAQHGKLGSDPADLREDPPNVFSPRPVSYFSGRDVISASAGSEHTVIHCSEGVYIWGNGEGGKLGHGHPDPVTDPAYSHLQHLQAYTPHLVSIGVDHTLIYATPR
eukprot:TRINITY_DN267_c3_g2_i1.p1 TRINITY_DN267_c3_g2~~TRINITY_DN267_c3_g2_i1.p1  ORF type:complete len:1894 (+),score=375.06 TRINITY_DN267_c3_g2_i1:44-5683(+)